MKKILAILIALITSVLLFAMTACTPIDNVDMNDNEEDNNYIAVTSISVSKTSMSLVVGERNAISATVYPYNATNKQVEWSTNNSAVADIVNGYVVALGEGSCIIKATCETKTATCYVTVENKKVTATTISFEYSEYTLFVGSNGYFLLNFSPSNLSDLSGTATVSNNTIATARYEYSNNNLLGNQVIKVYVTALKVGETTLNVTIAGGASCSMRIIVVENSENKVKVNLPTLPCEASYIFSSGKICTKTQITNISVTKNQVAAGNVQVTLVFTFKKSYDYEGSIATNTSLLLIALYKEDNVLCETEVFNNYLSIVGESWTEEYTFSVDVSSGMQREFTIQVLDYIS